MLKFDARTGSGEISWHLIHNGFGKNFSNRQQRLILAPEDPTTFVLLFMLGPVTDKKRTEVKSSSHMVLNN